MVFKFAVLVMLTLIVSLLVYLILRGEEDEVPAPAAARREDGEALRAEKRFSEGVLNVLNYENPMERGKGE